MNSDGHVPPIDYSDTRAALIALRDNPRMPSMFWGEINKILEGMKHETNVPDTNVGDTISRQAAIEALSNDKTDSTEIKLQEGEL